MLERRLLIISSDKNISDTMQPLAKNHGYSVLTVTELQSIQQACVSFKPTLMILDSYVSGIDGISLLNYLSNIHCKIELIMLGLDDNKINLAINNICKIKNLKLRTVLKRPLDEAEINKALQNLSNMTSTDIDARQIVKALEDEDFIMHYQPKIEIRSKKLWGFESLVRMQVGKKFWCFQMNLFRLLKNLV